MKTVINFCLLVVGITALPSNLPSTLTDTIDQNAAFSAKIEPIGISQRAALKLQSTIVDGINQNDYRLVTGSIVQAIEDASQGIKDAGLDPYHIKRKTIEYALPVPILFNGQALIEDLLVTGLSNIVVQEIDYSIVTNRLTMDIRLPRIELNLGKAFTDVTIFGSNTQSYASGKLAIVALGLRFNIRIRIGLLGGITIRDIAVNANLGGIDSRFKIVTGGQDKSKEVNNLLGKVIPGKLNEFSKEIDELLTIVFKDLIEANL